jgi:hypothetical protein
MDQHVEPAPQHRTQLFPGGIPLLLELLVRNRHIDDRKMEPQHLSTRHLLAETFYSQQAELIWLQKRNNRDRSPTADRVEIKGEIAIPVSGRRIPVVLSRAKGDSYPAEFRPSAYDCDL